MVDKKIQELANQLHRLAPEHGFCCRHSDDLTKRTRCEARQVAAYILYCYLGLSFPVIAKAIGYKDHTGALYAAKKVEVWDEDEEISSRIDSLASAVLQEAA